MLLAYVDESGDSGYDGSTTYTLGCVLLSATSWPTAFDGYIAFRRFLNTRFGIRVRDELKANMLIGGRGSATGLGERQRHHVYRQHMRLAAKLGATVFAVVVEKQLIRQRERNPRDIAWEFLLQRLERASTNATEPVLLIHDEGETVAVRKLARKARRAGRAGSRFGTGQLTVPFRLLIDDPVSRVSSQSYFVQLADLCAYAAFRRLHPPPARRSHICPTGMWDELGTARSNAANWLARGTTTPPPPVGIVVWPT